MTLIPGTPRRAKSAVSLESCWRTPSWLVERIRGELGGAIELDPFTEASNPTKARQILTPFEDGFTCEWPFARTIYVNPPFIEAAKAADRCIAESEKAHRPRIIFLGPAAVGTKWFHRLWKRSDDALFLEQRLRFEDQNGNLVGSPTRGTVLFGLNCTLRGLADLGTRGIAA